jgi:2'-5' RNA ligase
MEDLEDASEYLLVVPPDHQTDLMAKNEKRTLKNEFNCSLSANLKPHITICNFLLSEPMEQRLVSYLGIFAKSVRPFPVDISGFDHFQTHTLFLNIVSKKALTDMMKGIRTRYRKYMMINRRFPPKFPTSRPHITLARGMQPDQFERVWPKYEKKKFKASFEASELILLKKGFFDQTNYEVVNRFKLTGLSGGGTQLTIDF